MLSASRVGVGIGRKISLCAEKVKMANRHILAVNKLDDFKEWLVSDGWQIQEPKGYYEALRATKEGKKHPMIIYFRHDTNGGNKIIHYSVADRDCGVVGAYIRDRRKT